MTMFDIPSLCLLGLVFFLTYYYMKGRKPANFPPGPDGYPFIGNLNLLYKNPRFHRTLHELTKQYGDKVFGLQMGHLPVVVVSNVQLMKELFVQQADNFSIRPQNMTILNLLFKGKGIVFNKGESWKILRKMASVTIRDHGVGKASLQAKILEETEFLAKEIEKKNGEAFQFNMLLNQAVGNIICSILFGNRLSYDDPEYQKAVSAMNVIFSDSGIRNVFLFLPAITFPLIPLVQPSVGSMIKANIHVRDYVRKKIQDHRSTFDPNNIRDFIDVCLDTEQKETDAKLKSEVYTDEQILCTCLDMLKAGSDTSSSTLLWACYFLIKYPHIQTKCREEIKQVLGNQSPSQSDRKRLPYLEATIYEIQRCGNIGPVLVLHANERDTEVCGYDVPAGTVVIPNVYTVFNNPQHFPEPQAFKPERFLDQDGNLKRIDALIPFGIGRRACPGENLAKLEIFLFLTTLLQRFELLAPDPDNLPTMDDTTLGISHNIKRYDIIAKKL